jgi:peroxiredoxin
MRYDPPFSVVRFTESRQLPFTVVIDSTGSVAQGFGRIEATPTSLLIDKHGHIVKRYVGKPDFADLQRNIDRLLRKT